MRSHLRALLTQAVEKAAKAAAKAARFLLVHVSNCDGLAILSERFTKKEMEALADKGAFPMKLAAEIAEDALEGTRAVLGPGGSP